MSFKDDLERGQEFQDFVAEELWKQFKIPLIQYCSKKYQIEKGESVNGIEVKFDEMSLKTGNLYIEYQCQNKEGKWYDSGILRKDNTNTWVIGNYDYFFVFHRKVLQDAVDDIQFRKVRTGSQYQVCATKGVLIPLGSAKTLCNKYINFKGE